MRSFKILLTLFCFQSICTTSGAQSLGTWNLLNIKLQLTEKWAFIGEAQLRSNRFYKEFVYNEYKGGIQYKLDKNFSILIGIGGYDTYSSGGDFKSPMVNDETRTWVQVTMNQTLKRLKFEHRYRAEQRFTYSGYRNRFRYRIGCTVPLNKKVVEPNTVFTYAYNEIFLTNKAPYFERNRLSAGAGYEFSKIFTLQAGLLNQFDYKINSEASHNYLQVSLLFDIRPKFNVRNHPKSTLD